MGILLNNIEHKGSLAVSIASCKNIRYQDGKHARKKQALEKSTLLRSLFLFKGLYSQSSSFSVF